jgi:hypothetical protein
MMDEPNLSELFGMIGCVTAVKLRDWRGVKPVAGPCGVAIATRLRTTPDDEHVLDLVADPLRFSGLTAPVRRAIVIMTCPVTKSNTEHS